VKWKAKVDAKMTMITQIKTRKEQRKEKRKKRKRHDKQSVTDESPSQNKNPPFEKQISKSKSSSKTESGVKRRKKIKTPKDDIEKFPTSIIEDSELGEAIRRDEAEIAELEKKLGIGRGKSKEKLHKEYAKLEGFGDDFGDFLDDLDNLVDRVRTSNNVDDRKGTSDNETSDDDDDQEAMVKKSKKKEKKESKHSTPAIEHSRAETQYNNLDPALADALRRDDEEIAALEKKLCLSKRKEKDKLYREYSTLEGYGDDFGNFLDDLDEMVARIKQPSSDNQLLANENFSESLNSDSGGGKEDESEDEELVSMKGSSDEYDEDDSVLEELERMQHEESEIDRRMEDQNDNGEYKHDEDIENEDSSGSSSDDSRDASDTEPDHDVVDTYQPTQGEDIYGNRLDSDSSGDKKPSKYVPPHLRRQQQGSTDDEEDKERRRMILRSLNNGLNRLSGDTLVSVSQQIAKLYSSNPTPLVHELIWKNAKDACITTPMLMVGLIPIYIACIAGVHIQTGETVQIGETILENVVVDLLDRLKVSRGESSDSNDDDRNEIENKKICNLMLFLCYLYNYGIVHCSFIYDIIRHLIENFSEADVECLLILLNHCGRALRSDDPTALKEIVLLVQKKKSQNTSQSSSSRTEYMLSAIMDLKNNKKRKEDSVHAEKVAKFRKILGRIKVSAAKSGISKTSSESSLRISLNDIIQADTKGRWWKVGASWVGNQYRFVENAKNEDGGPDNDNLASSIPDDVEEGNEELLKLASKFRMNTDRKRAIFCIIMGGTDCEDTFEKLCRSSMLQNRTERDTVRVLMECCGNEKSYNRFYGHLAARICEYQPQSKFSLQLAYWDTFKQFKSIGARKGANLAKLLFHLIVTHRTLKLLPIIKTIDLSDDDMDEATLIFLTILFSGILEHFNDPTQAKAIFGRSASSAKNENSHDDADEGIRAGLLVFFMETLKSSPKNKKNSRFRKNFKAVVKELDTDGFGNMF